MGPVIHKSELKTEPGKPRVGIHSAATTAATRRNVYAMLIDESMSYGVLFVTTLMSETALWNAPVGKP
jgi:hypothetical protein